MEVILTPENEAALRSYIHEIITDEIAKARRDASVDKRVLKQIEIAKYFEYQLQLFVSGKIKDFHSGV